MVPVRFGSVTVWGGMVRAAPVFGSGGSSGKGPVFQYRGRTHEVDNQRSEMTQWKVTKRLIHS